MTIKTEFSLPPLTGFTEHLLFVALLLPTFVLLAAVAVSLTHPDPTLAAQAPVQTVAACEACLWDNGEYGP
ncbi:MAG: hypothetical protein JOZ85_07300 [Betaproteobacteria bacterium]|nr:hypothetical protein [Betaproteobacteria bacterium]